MTVVAEREEMTLERAIEQQINLGQKDPHAIFDVLKQQLGDEALVEMTVPYLADLITNMARQKMNTLRRADLAKITDASLADGEIMLRSLWVPSDEGIVYKRIADMTASDFDARADYLDRMVRAISRHADWCRDVAKKIRRSRVQVAGELKQLPGLPELEA